MYCKKIIILDSSAIINGLDSTMLSERQLTTPEVQDEVLDKKSKKNLELAFDLNKVEVRYPKQRFIDKIEAEVKLTGDKLSEQDKGLIALALEFSAENEVLLVSDDYGIQNIAKKLGIKFVPVSEHGIKKIFYWKYYCPGCNAKYKDSAVRCELCGTRLKRKPVKKL